MHALFSLPVFVLSGPLSNVHPYLDPGTGSYILQILIATILGGAFLMRGYIARGFRAIKRLIIKSEPKPETTPEPAAPETKDNNV